MMRAPNDVNALQTVVDDEVELLRREKLAPDVGDRRAAIGVKERDELVSRQLRKAEAVELVIVVVVDQRRLAAADGARQDALERHLHRHPAEYSQPQTQA